MRPVIIYKGKGSMRLSYGPYKQGSTKGAVDSEKGREACMFISMAKSSGNRVYDTSNALVISLGYLDVMRLLHANDSGFPPDTEGKDRIRFIHQYRGGTKILVVYKGQQEGTYGWSMKLGDESRSVYIDEAERYALMEWIRICSTKMITEGPSYDNNVRGSTAPTQREHQSGQ